MDTFITKGLGKQLPQPPSHPQQKRPLYYQVKPKLEQGEVTWSTDTEWIKSFQVPKKALECEQKEINCFKCPFRMGQAALALNCRNTG